ncbi:MAG: NAD(P)/FAD-dependent oxidoreductase [Pseudomonadota bacterium]
MANLETDYLVIGSGAVGMAFVDVLLDETDANIIIVDRHHAPGGHWNDAYPFVRLHQPSAFYGVSSRKLGADRIDEAGSNTGYFELASGAEVLAYFDQVMRERFLPSGRVRYFPMSDYKGDGRFQSLLSGDDHAVDVKKKVVDGTFFKTSVPSTHKRKYAVEDGVACITPNDLPRRAPAYKNFCVIGGGKTGMDAVVWLLDNGADPDAVRWVVSRDSWLLNRATTQPGLGFFKEAIGGFADQLEAAAKASDIQHLFDLLEEKDVMFRVEPEIRPTMFHYATISKGEIDQLRRVKDVVRGRVESISQDALVMQCGETVSAAPETLYVDCTATAVEFAGGASPIFEDGKITLQSVRSPLLPFSAAVAAYVEAHYDNDDDKNRLCKPVILADTPAQFAVSFLGNLMNQYTWGQEPALNAWINKNRLDPFGKVVEAADRSDPATIAILERVRDSMMPAAGNLQKLIANA